MKPEICGVERDLHRTVLGFVRFNLRNKCWFCKERKKTNKIIIWDRKDTLKLCSDCSVNYVNKDFTKLLEKLK